MPKVSTVWCLDLNPDILASWPGLKTLPLVLYSTTLAPTLTPLFLLNHMLLLYLPSSKLFSSAMVSFFFVLISVACFILFFCFLLIFKGDG